MQRLTSKVGHDVDLVGAKPWFDLGILYSDLDLAEHNDEVAAELLVDYIIKQGLL